MDCAHIDSLNIKNYMWHSSPYLWLTTRFLCSFPLRSIMAATSNSQVGAQAYQGCRDHEHIPLIYIGKPSSIWLKLARHWKQVTQRHFNSTQPDTWAEGGKMPKAKYLRHINIRLSFDQPHISRSPLIFLWNLYCSPALPWASVLFSVCLTFHIFEQQPPTKCHLLHQCISAFPWSLTPIPTRTDLPLGLTWSLPNN